jgi:3-methyladenine DNA glycosylase/8-oxoguanine DNA glycosylase
VPVEQILLQSRHGRGDPTYKVDHRGRHWRALGTPEGSATLVVEARPAQGEVYAAAWGKGRDWALAQVPAMLGAADDVSDFDPREPALNEIWRRNSHHRIGRTGLVMEALVPAIIEQKVTGQEAFASFRGLVQRFGNAAPGPGHDMKLQLQPDADTLRAIPSWEWLKLSIDPSRSRAVVIASRNAAALERTLRLDSADAERALCSQPGIGEWTAAEVRQRAFGDADAVSFGDYHVSKEIGWTMRGEPMSDDELRDFLEPWRPHRGRVQFLVALGGRHRPRRGPRMAPRTHLPVDRVRPPAPRRVG